VRNENNVVFSQLIYRRIRFSDFNSHEHLMTEYDRNKLRTSVGHCDPSTTQAEDRKFMRHDLAGQLVNFLYALRYLYFKTEYYQFLSESQIIAAHCHTNSEEENPCVWFNFPSAFEIQKYAENGIE
jgi:hypothetical protein